MLFTWGQVLQSNLQTLIYVIICSFPILSQVNCSDMLERDKTDLEPLIQYPEWDRFGPIAGPCTGPSIHLIRVKWIN